MPLMKRKSQKAFEHNLKAEMHAGKPQDQALAIAYSIKRRAKKAKGGMIHKNDSAKTESRPMPEERDNDHQEVSRNEHKKALVNSNVLDQPELKQAGKGLRTTKIKHPKMVPNSPFTSRLRDEEDDLMHSEAPASPKEQPPKRMDEEEADKSGPETHDLHLKRMASGGSVESGSRDMNMAEGGDVHHEMDEQPEEEAMLDHAASVAAAVMARRKRRQMAHGGHINGTDSTETHENIDQADLARNAEEDANMEDQQSFDALRKENYDESYGLECLDRPADENLHGDDREEHEENRHDRSLVSKIRSKMKKRSPISE